MEEALEAEVTARGIVISLTSMIPSGPLHLKVTLQGLQHLSMGAHLSGVARVKSGGTTGQMAMRHGIGVGIILRLLHLLLMPVMTMKTQTSSLLSEWLARCFYVLVTYSSSALCGCYPILLKPGYGLRSRGRGY